MQPNGQIEKNDLNILRRDEGSEIECYACAYCIDSTTLNIKRNLEPTKGILKRSRYNDIVFFPYGKRGQLLKTGISFYGNGYGTELTANVNEEEIYKIWSNLKVDAFNRVDIFQKKLNRIRDSIEETFKGV